MEDPVVVGLTGLSLHEGYDEIADETVCPSGERSSFLDEGYEVERFSPGYGHVSGARSTADWTNGGDTLEESLGLCFLHFSLC